MGRRSCCPQLSLLGDNPLHERRGDGLYGGVVGGLRVGRDRWQLEFTRLTCSPRRSTGAGPELIELARLAPMTIGRSQMTSMVQISATGH